MTDFKDHFSGHAAAYASYRPGYPPALFDFVAALPRRRDLAWDCATGNGQAAVGLAGHFAHVVATDASADQLAHAAAHSRIEYRVATAERSGLADCSIDLVTAAQAFHWFDFDRFFAEARRVLAPGGAIALWTYNLARAEPAVSRAVDHLATEIAGSYWPPERRWVDEEYRTIPFPFPEVEAPSLTHEESWNLEQLILYLRTWSACVRYEKATGEDPLARVYEELLAAWGDPETVHTVYWPIFLRASQPLGG
jgi:SAM-dependent methyltransferase